MTSFPRSEAGLLRTLWVPGALALVAATGVALTSRTPNELEASGSTAVDTDGDGLVDAQEEVLGTYIDLEDSDDDGFSDLEEIARASDPLDETSVPGSAELSIGLTSRADDGVITLVAPIYAQAGSFAGIDFEFGLVFPDGSPLTLKPNWYLPVLRAAVHAPQSANHRVLVLEMPVPQSLLQGFGSLSFYGTVDDPNIALSASAAAVNLVDFSGVPVMAQNAPPGYSAQPGIIYAPIVPDEDIPASWVSGEICWQQASAVGMVGSSTAYEVTVGLCTSSDTYCSTQDCTARVGTSMLLTDPATLLGG